MLADELRSQGLQVLEASNADEALDRSGKFLAGAFVVHRHPHAGPYGRRGAGRSSPHARFPQIKSIIGSSGQPEAIGDFADAFLAKPYDLRELADRSEDYWIESENDRLAARRSAKAGETVLVVEDDILLRLSIAAYLRDCGYRVIEAADADEAVVVLKRPDLEVDVLFSDVEMPGAMDGFGARPVDARERPGTGSDPDRQRPARRQCRGQLCEDGPVPKPYEPQAVHDRIRRLLAARPPRPPKDAP